MKTIALNKTNSFALFLFLLFSNMAFIVDAQIAKSAKRKSIVEMISEKEQAVVKIAMHTSSGFDRDRGTGFFIEESGVVITNYHVVADSWHKGLVDFYIQTIDGNIYERDSILGYNPVADVFVFSIKNTKHSKFKHLSVNYCFAPKGQEIFLIGHPADFNWLYSPGYITGILSDKDSLKDYVFDAAILPGSSGSPLLNQNGEVIGIAKATYGNSARFNIATRSSFFKQLIPYPTKEEKKTPDNIVTENEIPSSINNEDSDQFSEENYDSMDKNYKNDDYCSNMMRGEQKEKSKDYFAAVNAFKIASVDKRFNEDLWVRLSRLYYKIGDYTNTIYSANRALSIEPRNIDALNIIGKCLYEQKKYIKAKRIFKRILKIDLQNTIALHYIGKIETGL